MSCGKKINEPSTSNAPKFPTFHHCNLCCLGFFGITFVQVELHLEATTERLFGGKPARFWVNPTSLCFTNKTSHVSPTKFKALLKKGIPRFHLEKLEFNLGDSKIPGFQDSRIGGANDPTPNPKVLSHLLLGSENKKEWQTPGCTKMNAKIAEKKKHKHLIWLAVEPTHLKNTI